MEHTTLQQAFLHLTTSNITSTSSSHIQITCPNIQTLGIKSSNEKPYDLDQTIVFNTRYTHSKLYQYKSTIPEYLY